MDDLSMFLAEKCQFLSSKLTLPSDINLPEEIQQHLVIGEVPLSLNQQGTVWFTGKQFPHIHVLHSFWQVTGPIEPETLRQALFHLLCHHDALRSCFAEYFLSNGDWRWKQFIVAPQHRIPLTWIDLSKYSKQEQQKYIISVSKQTSLDIEEDPQLNCVYFFLGEHEPGYMLLFISHLVCDFWSSRIIMEDLSLACNQLYRKEKVQFSRKTSSLKRWSGRMFELASSDYGKKHIELLRSYRQAWPSSTTLSSLPTDYPRGISIKAIGSFLQKHLNDVETAAMQRFSVKYKVQIIEILLAAIALAFKQWAGICILPISIDSHGRETFFEDLHVLRTVGNFAIDIPDVIDLNGTTNANEALQYVKERWRQVPHKNVAVALSRFLDIVEEELSYPFWERYHCEVHLNYTGRVPATDDSREENDIYFRPASLPLEEQYGQFPVSNMLKCSAAILNRKLWTSWEYDPDLYHSRTIDKLASNCMAAIIEMISR